MKLQNKKGQAVIEMALSLPFLIWLIYYTINAYLSIHTAQIGQRYAAMATYQRMNHRSKIVVDDVARTVVNKNFQAVQYLDAQGNGAPSRKILIGPLRINTVIGVCGEPECN